MNHGQRVELANRITKMFLDSHGDDVLLGGICGSTARGTDVEDSDLEMLMIVKNESGAADVYFTYESMPVSIIVQKVADVEKDINKIEIDWPQKMGRLFTLDITCGNPDLLEKFKTMLKGIPKESFDKFLSKETPLCYEGLGKLKAVRERGNIEDIYLFVAEILGEFMLLTAILNQKFINQAYLGGLRESYGFDKLPRDYETNARRLLRCYDLDIDETVRLAEEFVTNFVTLLEENGIQTEEHTPIEELEF